MHGEAIGESPIGALARQIDTPAQRRIAPGAAAERVAPGGADRTLRPGREARLDRA